MCIKHVVVVVAQHCRDVKLVLSVECLYWFGFTVSKSGMVCSLFDVVEKDKSPKSLSALLQKLEEEGLVSVALGIFTDLYCSNSWYAS